jgi:hypothetical protein
VDQTLVLGAARSSDCQLGCKQRTLPIENFKISSCTSRVAHDRQTDRFASPRPYPPGEHEPDGSFGRRSERRTHHQRYAEWIVGRLSTPADAVTQRPGGFRSNAQCISRRHRGAAGKLIEGLAVRQTLGRRTDDTHTRVWRYCALTDWLRNADPSRGVVVPTWRISTLLPVPESTSCRLSGLRFGIRTTCGVSMKTISSSCTSCCR